MCHIVVTVKCLSRIEVESYSITVLWLVFQTQEEMLRERIRSIGQMERRYDALQAEKRNVSSESIDQKRES